jgi:hypothetical protein
LLRPDTHTGLVPARAGVQGSRGKSRQGWGELKESDGKVESGVIEPQDRFVTGVRRRRQRTTIAGRRKSVPASHRSQLPMVAILATSYYLFCIRQTQALGGLGWLDPKTPEMSERISK